MGQDLPDHARNRTHVLLGVVNVVQHVYRDQPAQCAARDQFAGAPHAVLVDVVVPRHAHQPGRVGARRHLLDLGHRDADRLFHQHVLAGRQRLQGQLVVALQVGEHVHGVDGGVGEQLVDVLVARATPGLRLLLGPRRGAVPQSHQPRAGATPHRLRVQVGHHPGAEEPDSQLFHVAETMGSLRRPVQCRQCLPSCRPAVLLQCSAAAVRANVRPRKWNIAAWGVRV